MDRHPPAAGSRAARRPPRATVTDSSVLFDEEISTALVELADVIAGRVVELLDRGWGAAPSGLATAAEVAERLGVHKSWVYANQQRLGAVRLGTGPKARLRFDIERAARVISGDPKTAPPRRAGRPRKTRALPPGVELLRGRQGTSGL